MKKIFLKKIIASTLALCLSLGLGLSRTDNIVKANTNDLNTESNYFENYGNIVYLKNTLNEISKSDYFIENFNEINDELTIKYNIEDETIKSENSNESTGTIQKSETVKLINKNNLRKDFRKESNIIDNHTTIWVDIEYLNDNSVVENLVDLFNNGNKLIFVGENINEYEERISKIFNFTNIPYDVEGESLTGNTLMPMGFLIEKLNDDTTNTCGINVEAYTEEHEVLGALLGATQEEKLNDKYLELNNKSLERRLTSRSGYDDWRTAQVHWSLYIDGVGSMNGNPRYQVAAVTDIRNRNELDPNRYQVRGLNQLDLRIDDMGNNKIRMNRVRPAEKDEKFTNISLGFGFPWSISVGLSFNRNATRVRHTSGGSNYSHFATNFWPVGHYPSKFEGGISGEVENKGPASMPIKMSYTIEMFYMDVINNTQHFAKGSEYWTWRSDW